MQRFLVLAVLIGALGLARGAAAEPTCHRATLDVEARRARTWRYAWSGINAGVMLASFSALPLVSRESRPDWIISGVGSGLTLVATWIFPLRVESAAAELAALPPSQRALALPRLLRESADDEHARLTWPWHVANVVLSAAGGAVIAFGYDHYVSGAVTFVAGTALGEVQLLTQPTGLVNACAHQAFGVWQPRLAFVPAGVARPASWSLSLSTNF